MRGYAFCVTSEGVVMMVEDVSVEVKGSLGNHKHTPSTL